MSDASQYSQTLTGSIVQWGFVFYLKFNLEIVPGRQFLSVQ